MTKQVEDRKGNPLHLRPQDIAPKTVLRSTYWQSLIITFLATLVIVTIANWFLYKEIQGEARAAVHQDIQLVKDSGR
jgi:hypothetical protein